ncbi:MAG: hypothetical protein ACHQEA_04115 [Gaiellales bacterium]
MSDRTLRWLAWAALAAVALLLAAGVVLMWATRHVAHSEGFSGGGTAGFLAGLLIMIIFLLYPLAGAVIVRSRPRNPVGWLLIATGLSWALVVDAIGYGDWAFKVHPGQIPVGAAAASVSLWAWAPAVAITGVFLLLVYPDGHLPSRRWRWVVYVCAFAVGVSMLDWLLPGPMRVTGFPDHDNPFGIEALDGVLSPLQSVVLLIPLSSVAAVASLVVRYRRAERIERLQIKWLAAAGTLCGALYFVSLVSAALMAGDHGETPGWIAVVQDVWFVCLGLIPIAIGIAVLRYRLFEIDVIIRRTLIYATLIGALAVLYLGGAALIGSALRGLTGSSGTLAVTVSTLAVAAAFQPLRRVIQRAVDRRFYRAGYDAQAAVDGFSERLREQIDLDALCEELRSVVSGTVQPAHATVWLRGDAGDRPPR